MGRPKPSVVLFVDDVQRMTQFYKELARMAVVHDASDHAVLELDGIQLVIHALPPRPREQPTTSHPVTVRQDSHWKLCLPVGSIADARAIATTLGGSIKSPEHEWEARGFRACDGHDSEGNVLQVRQSAA